MFKKTLGHFVPEKRVLDIKDLHSIGSYLVSCVKEGISQTIMALEEKASTEVNLKMKTSNFHMMVQVRYDQHWR